MEGSGYVRGGSQTYERSKLASRGISVVAGLAALVGGTYSALAQDAQPIAYSDTNLAQHGVPSVDGKEPYRTKFLDKTQAIPGDETRIDAYRVGDGFVATYSINDRLYAVGMDMDGKRPVDYSFIDNNGDGQFVEQPTGKKFSAPNWLYE